MSGLNLEMLSHLKIFTQYFSAFLAIGNWENQYPETFSIYRSTPEFTIRETVYV